MYIDSVIISGILVVVATTAVVIYAGKYMLTHIRDEMRKMPEDSGHPKS